MDYTPMNNFDDSLLTTASAGFSPPSMYVPPTPLYTTGASSYIPGIPRPSSAMDFEVSTTPLNASNATAQAIKSLQVRCEIICFLFRYQLFYKNINSSLVVETLDLQV